MAAGKKIAVLGLAVILVVGAVVAVTVTLVNKNKQKSSKPESVNSGVKANKKAIETVCEGTDHKNTCVETLNSAAGEVTSPQELVKIAFNVTMKKLDEASKSPEFQKLLTDLGKDPSTSTAFDNCNELFALAVRDLERSKEKLFSLDINQIDEIMDTIKIWLSGALTYEETCIDGFMDTPGDASQKVREALKTVIELTENTMGMVEEVASFLADHGHSTSSSRRLLSTTTADGIPSWASGSTRKILNAPRQNIQADLVVAKDGSGKFKSIIPAIESIPRQNRKKPYVVHIKAGVYNEHVVIPKDLVNLVIIGDGPRKTKVTGSLAVPPEKTFHAPSFIVMADNFVARDMGFENTAGPLKHQAPAIRVTADLAAFQNCRFDSYQDTLYAHTYRQYYRYCTISGTVDFIFGNAAAVFQNCNMLIRRPNNEQFNAVTAHARENKKSPTGFILQNCNIMADPQNPPLPGTKSYLGRPWKAQARVIIMESDIGALIEPEGWRLWDNANFHETCFYSEYNNRGARANTTTRVKWNTIHAIKKEVAEMFTADKFIGGSKWIPATKVPYHGGFFFPMPKNSDKAIGLAQSGVWKKEYVKGDYDGKKQR